MYEEKPARSRQSRKPGGVKILTASKIWRKPISLSKWLIIEMAWPINIAAERSANIFNQ
jgi:hypothetical protein